MPHSYLTGAFRYVAAVARLQLHIEIRGDGRTCLNFMLSMLWPATPMSHESELGLLLERMRRQVKLYCQGMNEDSNIWAIRCTLQIS